jgi:hypothetical protein
MPILKLLTSFPTAAATTGAPTDPLTTAAPTDPPTTTAPTDPPTTAAPTTTGNFQALSYTCFACFFLFCMFVCLFVCLFEPEITTQLSRLSESMLFSLLTIRQLFTAPQCPEPSSLGDGFCEDNLNIELCHFDGGDCCLAVIDSNFCTDCLCNTDELKHPGSYIQ